MRIGGSVPGPFMAPEWDAFDKGHNAAHCALVYFMCI